NAADGAAPNQVGDVKRRRRADHGEYIGSVLLIEADDVGDELGVKAPALRKERATRAVHQTANQNLGLGRAGFAAEVVTGDATRGVALFLVLTGERQEVHAGARALGAVGGHEQHGLAKSDHDGSTGLLGPLAGFDG